MSDTPRVLISDKLSEAPQISSRTADLDVDFLPDLGKDKDALLANHRGL
jgi:D-3-phosphoglycerate dehydrogenase